MAKGTPITIAGSAYTRQARKRSAKRKTKSATGGTNKKRKLVGSGDYYYRYKGKTPFADVGRHIGSYFGYGDIGSALGHGIGRILGSGDYSTGPMVKSNVLVNSTEVPEFLSEGRANMIMHREYLGDIITSSTPGAFKLQSFTINPGQSESFPWLATIAQNYEQYKIHGMVYCFKSTSGESVASTNTALGTVIMASDYNVNSPQYRSKSEMENSQFAQSFKASQSAMHGIECEPEELPLKNYYVRTGGVAANDSIKWYDLANFQIATQGFQAASVNIGELWVTYLVEFFKPQIPLSIGGIINSARIVRSSTTNAAPLGLIGVKQQGNLAVGASSTGVSLTEVQPLEIYKIDIMWVCTAAVAWTPPVVSLTGASFVSVSATNTAGADLTSFVSPTSGVATSTEFGFSGTFQVTSSNTDNVVNVTVPSWVGPVNVSNFVTILVTQIDNTLLA